MHTCGRLRPQVQEGKALAALSLGARYRNIPEHAGQADPADFSFCSTTAIRLRKEVMLPMVPIVL
jgi:hypothetical protein